MQVDHVLILAAGKGTRMGRIGQKLPKLLWPVFENPLFELQVLFAKHLAPKANIYMNCFHYGEKIRSAVMQSNLSSGFELVIENQPLDIGGAIHNLARKLNYTGNLLVLNGDQFLTIEKDQISSALNRLKTNNQVLFSYPVSSSENYNALDCTANGKLRGIILNSNIPRNKIIQTYTGTSLISLDKLVPKLGESRFFESIANPDMSSTIVESLKSFEYWDFGTVERYHRSHFDLLKSQKSIFFDFLLSEKAINYKKLDKLSYGTKRGINLSSRSDIKIAEFGLVLNHCDDQDLPDEGAYIAFGKIIESL